jgi:hypothetical protein
MNNLLSAISGKFAKMIILGTMFPVVIITALNIFLVAPLLPLTQSLPDHLSKIAVGDEKWSAVLLSLVVFVLTGLLYDLNTPIIQFYEGYGWQKSLIGIALRAREKRRQAKAKDLVAEATALRRLMTLTNPSDPLLLDVLDQESSLSLFLNYRFPNDPSLLLPTRLGNVMRCFEYYSFQAYGMDSIALWPRLTSKIDQEFATTVDDVKTTFDFMLNISFLSGVTSFGILVIGLAVPAPLQPAFFLPLLWRASLFGFLGIIFYYFSINRARAWGVQVKSAFDLYRLPLLSALGYQQKPLTYQEERALWLQISSQLLYADDRTVPLPYNEPLTRVIPFPSDIKLRVRRYYDTQQPNLRIPVRIELQNPGSRYVTSLIVIDSLPEGYKYVADSVSFTSEDTNVDDIGFEVARLAPPEFFLGPIPPGVTLTLSYLMKPANT